MVLKRMPKDYFNYNPEEDKEVISEADKEGHCYSCLQCARDNFLASRQYVRASVTKNLKTLWPRCFLIIN